MQWVSLSYLVALAALLIPARRLADAHGRKLLYLYGFVVFAATSAACRLAPSLGALMALRVLHGAGAALMQANNVTLIATSAHPHRLPCRARDPGGCPGCRAGAVAHGQRADDLQPRVAVGILARPARDRVRDLHAANNSLVMPAMPARIAGTGGGCSI